MAVGAPPAKFRCAIYVIIRQELAATGDSKRPHLVEFCFFPNTELLDSYRRIVAGQAGSSGPKKICQIALKLGMRNMMRNLQQSYAMLATELALSFIILLSLRECSGFCVKESDLIVVLRPMIFERQF